MTAGLTRQAVEDFLYHEAALLDQGKLDEWLGLLTGDCVCRVSCAAAHAAPGRVADDYARMRERVARLKDPHALAGLRTRRIVSNVRILDRRGDEMLVEANFVIHRFEGGRDSSPCVGGYRFRLRLVEGIVKIAARDAVLDGAEAPLAQAADFIL